MRHTGSCQGGRLELITYETSRPRELPPSRARRSGFEEPQESLGKDFGVPSGRVQFGRRPHNRIDGFVVGTDGSSLDVASDQVWFRSACRLKHGRTPFALDGEDGGHRSNLGLCRWRRD
jgi:hypothetical protein